MTRSIRSRWSRRAPLLCLALLMLAWAVPAHALRIASYNLLNYDNALATRNPHFLTVLSNLPALDVIGVQEVQDLTAMSGFKTNVLDVVEPGAWSMATFFNDPDQSFNQGLFYRTSTVDLVAADTLGNDPRDISWFKIRPDGYSATAAEIIIFVTHYKASSGGANEAIREAEAQRLRAFMNTQPVGTQMIVLGDFNMQSSSENAYQDMVGSQANNIGRVKDPINAPGTWNNNASFAAIHTQSPRTTSIGDGGATGGMDDRFDQILISYLLDDGAGLDQVPGTMTAFGNDGLHFNLALTDAPTIPQGAAVATALHNASDHLPIYLQFQLPAKIDADPALAFGTVIVGASANLNLMVQNTASAPADELDYTLVAPVGFTVPGGPFQLNAGASTNHSVTMLTGTFGVKGGNLSVASDDVDTPNTLVPVSGTVLRHAVPSVSASGQVLADTLDFGCHMEGDFADSCVSVSNDGHDSLQALLDIYAGAITGGNGRFTIVGGFSPASVGGTPEKITLNFDDNGAATTADTTFTALLTLNTRDQQGLLGATNLSDLTVMLTATVKAASQAGVDDPTLPALTVLAANRPNPFQSRTVIAFTLAESGPITLSIFDIQGRRVRTLASEFVSAGTTERTWDGRTDSGVIAGPGIYFYRLETPTEVISRRMTKLR